MGTEQPSEVALALLGDVRWRGNPVEGARARELLAALALHPSGGLGAERLVEQLWGEAPPANPKKALQVAVSRTRAATSPEVIVNTPRGYRLGLHEQDVDVLRVAGLVERARERIEAGDTAGARAMAEEAIQRGRGDGGAETTEGTLGRLRAAAAQRHEQARALLGRALSMQGEHAAALDPLRAAVEREPGDERVLACLLRSEAAARGTGAALERYERYRAELAERTGADPGARLRAVHAELLAADRPVRTGVRFDATELLGRAQDVRNLRSLLNQERVVSVVGPGGLGKTRLAHTLGRETERPVVRFVELVGVTGAEEVVGEVGSALGVRDSVSGRGTLTPAQRADIRSRIAATLDGAPTLLILDNCEHVIEAAAELVAFLIAATRNLSVLTTSRAPLAIAGERVYELRRLAAADATELFRRRAEGARPGVALPQPPVTEIVTRLDGVPLAIELAAAKVRVMSVEDIAGRLEHRFALLRGGDRSAPDRHRTLLAVIDWSWNLLADAERAALRRLSVFHDGFALPAAEAVLGVAAVDSLQQLAEQSLVTVRDTQAGVRYGMLETVREFGRMRLVEAGEDAETHAAQARWAGEYAALALAKLYGPEQIAAVDRLRAEETNLADVLRRALGQEEPADAIVLVAALGTYWTIAGEHERVMAIAEAVEHAIAGWSPPPELADTTRIALTTLINTRFMLSQEPRGPAWSLLHELGAGSGGGAVAALVLVTLAADPARGERREGLHALCEHPDGMVAARALQARGYELENAGRPEAAIVDITRALTVYTEDAGPWLGALLHAQLAELHAELGMLDRGIHHAEQALPILDRLDSVDDVVSLRTLFIVAAVKRGDLAQAQRLLDAVSRVAQNRSFIGSGVFVATIEAELALAKGERAGGLRRYREACVAARELRLGNTTTTGFEPWVLYMQAAALAAHTVYGSGQDGADLFDALRETLLPLLRSGRVEVPGLRTLDYPMAGLAMYAVALWGLHRDALAPAVAARLGVLAERFGYNRMLPSTAWHNLADPAEAATPGLLARIAEEYGRRRGEQLLDEARAFVEQSLPGG